VARPAEVSTKSSTEKIVPEVIIVFRAIFYSSENLSPRPRTAPTTDRQSETQPKDKTKKHLFYFLVLA
jgi:hypothetical protein